MATSVSLAALFCIVVLAKTVALQITSSCDTGWDTFGKSDFVRTAYNKHDPTNFQSFEGYFDHDFGLQGLFVHPESRLAVCLMEKNACSMLTELMNMILRANLTAGKDYHVSSASQEYYRHTGLDNVFKDPQAVRAVFVRDPLKRFVSAFLNKCIPNQWSSTEDCPAYKDGGIVFREAVDWALNTANFENAHWREQALHCQLQHRLHQYSVIGLITKETFAQDVSCVLNKVGLSNITRKYFEAHERPANQSPLAKITEEDILKRLFTPTAARKLISRLHKDYDTFGFEKEPPWIEQATGEWYEQMPSVFALNRKASVTDEDEDEDDVLMRAWRAGFMNLPQRLA